MNDGSKTDKFAIRLFACLLIFCGVDAIVEMGYGLWHNSLSIDFSFLGILIGKGLLERKDACRKWAVFLAWVGIVSPPVAGALLAYSGSLQPVELYGLKTVFPSYLAFIILGAWFAFSLWQRRVLAKPEVRDLFSTTVKGRDSWWVAIAATAILFFCLHYSTVHFLHSSFESIGHHEATLHVVDVGTGKPLNPTVGGPSMSSSQVLPKVSVGFLRSEGRISAAKVSWVACRPVTVDVSSEGYIEKDVVLKPEDDGEELRIHLEAEESPNKSIESHKE